MEVCISDAEKCEILHYLLSTSSASVCDLYRFSEFMTPEGEFPFQLSTRVQLNMKCGFSLNGHDCGWKGRRIIHVSAYQGQPEDAIYKAAGLYLPGSPHINTHCPNCHGNTCYYSSISCSGINKTRNEIDEHKLNCLGENSRRRLLNKIIMDFNRYNFSWPQKVQILESIVKRCGICDEIIARYYSRYWRKNDIPHIHYKRVDSKVRIRYNCNFSFDGVNCGWCGETTITVRHFLRDTEDLLMAVKAGKNSDRFFYMNCPKCKRRFLEITYIKAPYIKKWIRI